MVQKMPEFDYTQFLLVKKLEIEKTKTTFITSFLKVVYQVVLFFLKSIFFTN